eukprot:Trichotokara_eunicae@DN5154_c0_g1_i3.p1
MKSTRAPPPSSTVPGTATVPSSRPTDFQQGAFKGGQISLPSGGTGPSLKGQDAMEDSKVDQENVLVGAASSSAAAAAGNAAGSTGHVAASSPSSPNSSELAERNYATKKTDRLVQLYKDALDEAIKREIMIDKLELALSVVKEVNFGDELRVTGNCEVLGHWDPEAGTRMSWTAGHKWTATVHLDLRESSMATATGPMHSSSSSPIATLEYKYVIINQNYGAVWEPGSNHLVNNTSDNKRLTIEDGWGEGGDRHVAVTSCSN